ncbi:MarR family transcriptional regulator [Paraburkholderia sp. JHI869]|uniref:MarR family winged helix-turn-helix transcriptional regulator n=1 Tax=Paraburkholderia sp. JHI869 TaxID=3112959 RepID=UPI00316F8C23
MNDPVNADFERTQRLVFVLGQAHHLMATELREGLKDAGLNLQERGILLTLASGSAKTPAALSRLLGVHPARMTRVLDKLEASGFVARTRNDADRRLVDISLTREGSAVAARNADVAPGAWSDRLSHFSKSDFDALSTLLTRLLHG